jgi:hypothetical protein
MSTLYRMRADALAALGRHVEAAHDLAIAVERSGDDPQHRDYLKTAVARAEFRSDPDAALSGLRGPHPELEGYPNAELTIAIWLARLAYRAGHREALEEALSIQEHHRDRGGPGRPLERRWALALSDEDIEALVSVADGFADIGWTLYSAEARVDAALVEARSGEGDVALRQAQAAVADIGYEPLLGPLPETRWVGVGMVAT